ncbi:annulin-like [Mya arenaria]|uniref:annulin-like n=1 Tax=Mya arenaria TaxID=6604 RepID=UPI0022E06860|nr:annulin-like [Mya arenaria]
MTYPEEEELFDGWWTWLYGPQKHKDEVRASEEDLKGALLVSSINLEIAENVCTHHTDQYDCTESREEDGKTKEAELVVRRGQEFNATVTFQRPYNKEKDDLQFFFSTGENGDRYPETHGRFMLDEDGKPNFKANEWGGCLVNKKDKTLQIQIHIPANCAIGKWSFSVDTVTILEDSKTKTLRYENPDDFYILYNPWCKDDQTYMADSKLLEEYVLNDHGCVYRGSAWAPKAKEWNFGQFESGILDASLHVMNMCVGGYKRQLLADPIRVARFIAKIVNSQGDNGVLAGNWSGKYEGGTSPCDWYGSVRILRQYMETKCPVKYGQCWVFSGVVTTVCRALGLPARSVTNFKSAHDTDESVTIDVYYKYDEKKRLVRDKMKTDDSIWNFHVWNEVWMSRPDIRGNDRGMFDGWQVIDSTPQERSEGVFTCGPCPVFAVKHGMVRVPYDTPFVFAEVNADQCFWKPECGSGYKIYKVKNDSVGAQISTKKADGKPYDANAWFDLARKDITDNYKFPDGSDESRRAVMRAALGARKPKDAYTGNTDKDDIVFKLLHKPDLSLGQDVEITLLAKNVSDNNRDINSVTFQFLKEKYDGHTSKRPFKVIDLNDEVDLKRGKEHKFTVTLKASEYMNELDEDRCMCIQAYALVDKTWSHPQQNCIKQHSVDFGVPTLQVKIPSDVKCVSQFEVQVTFKNPLKEELTSCKAGYEGRGFPHVVGVKQDNVPVGGEFKACFQLKGEKKGKFTLTFKFTSKQLKFLSGSAQVKVN